LTSTSSPATIESEESCEEVVIVFVGDAGGEYELYRFANAVGHVDGDGFGGVGGVGGVGGGVGGVGGATGGYAPCAITVSALTVMFLAAGLKVVETSEPFQLFERTPSTRNSKPTAPGTTGQPRMSFVLDCEITVRGKLFGFVTR
jgi:hypothetical protein